MNTHSGFRVLYFAEMHPLHGAEVVLKAVRMLRDEPVITFEVIGPLPRRLPRPKQQNVCYINWLSQEELAEHIAQADLCLAGHFNDEIAKAKRTIPGKAYIFEAMQKPMILGESKANRERFGETASQVYVPQGDAKALANAIKEMSH